MTANTRSALAAVLLPIVLSSTASAQVDDNLGGLTRENAEGYLGPLPEAFSGALNTGIFRTGYVAKEGLNVQIGVVAMAVAFDDETRTYNPSIPSDFSPSDPDSQYTASTVVGDEAGTTVDGAGGTSLTFPGGFNIENFALAVPQLTIGSVAGTKATVRWIAVDLGDADLGEVSLFGIGAQHSISQYFEALPVDLAGGIFFQSFKLGKDDLVKSTALHIGVTASKTFGPIQPYAGLGFDSYSFEVNYENDEGENTELKFDAENSPHLTLGGALMTQFFQIHAELNLASSVGVALGLSGGF